MKGDFEMASRIIACCIALYCNSCFAAHAAGVQGEWIPYGNYPREYRIVIDEKQQTITVPDKWLFGLLPQDNAASEDEEKKTLRIVSYVLYDDDPLRLGRVPEDAPPIRLGRVHEDVLILRTHYKTGEFEIYTPVILLRKGVNFKTPTTKPKGRWFFSKPGTEYNPAIDIVLDLDKATETAYTSGETPSRSLGTSQFSKRSKAAPPYVSQFGGKSIQFRFLWLCEGLLLLDINSKFPPPGTLLLRPYVKKN